MANVILDHLYRETHHWEESTTWWGSLGFAFTREWGSPPHRAGRLENGRAAVVLAEVPSEAAPAATVFLATDDLEEIADVTAQGIVDTHWGTRLVSLTDPDGRTYNFEPGNFEPGTFEPGETT